MTPSEKKEELYQSIYDKRITCLNKLSAGGPTYYETFTQCEKLIKPHGSPYHPLFPLNNRTTCFERLIDNQKSTKQVDEEYITVSLAEGHHRNAEIRLAGLQESYRVMYMQCAAAIQPSKVDMVPPLVAPVKTE